MTHENSFFSTFFLQNYSFSFLQNFQNNFKKVPRFSNFSGGGMGVIWPLFKSCKFCLLKARVGGTNRSNTPFSVFTSCVKKAPEDEQAGKNSMQIRPFVPKISHVIYGWGLLVHYIAIWTLKLLSWRWGFLSLLLILGLRLGTSVLELPVIHIMFLLCFAG